MSLLMIDPEFESLITPLKPDEYAELEKSILEEGCRDPIITWKGVIVDGHNRYAICRKHNLEFKTVERDFESRDDAKVWMIRNQIGRRNLNDYERSRLALKMKPLISKKAKENQAQYFGNQYQSGLCQNSDKVHPIDTKKELAKISDVSHDTISKVEFIETNADEEMKEAVRSGKISINAAATYLKVQEKIKPTAPLFTSDSNEWYTPPEIVSSVLEVFGEIDLDPCSNSHVNPNIPAKRHFTKDDDGLSKSWWGKVYMNPPYGRDVRQWVEKIYSEFKDGNVSEAIVLVAGRIDTQWFNILAKAGFIWCAIEGRLCFSNCENNAPFPSVVFFMPSDQGREQEFYWAFKKYGPIYRLIEDEEMDQE